MLGRLYMEQYTRFDIAYMKMAHIWAANSHCKRKQVGAFIVKNDTIVSDGFNGTPQGLDNCCENDQGETKWQVIHAEANAICKLANSTNSADGATLYTTLSPCKECSKLIIRSGITKVIFDVAHSDMDGVSMLRTAGIMVTQLKLDEINN